MYNGGCLIPQCPPKIWEARSWSGEGRRPSGTLHSTGFTPLDRACSSSSSSSSLKCVWLPWPWWSLASSNWPYGFHLLWGYSW
ncbi:unnamed protein product [Microthlaspi erraticum]|uniref:Uncharacterized protein n=1 Tax=Microthlaspi erraticum TaxID=1685480 RepID=A0A6D2KS45_9BRAS|nr:unnamed protein product [Microthlaspi erraticum]